MDEKPLFIALMKIYFEQFENDEKEFEFRKYGKRWNEKTCRVGREVVLSCGYGKARRLYGRITSFCKSNMEALNPDFVACYGEGSGPAAKIGIEVTQTEPKRAKWISKRVKMIDTGSIGKVRNIYGYRGIVDLELGFQRTCLLSNLELL